MTLIEVLAGLVILGTVLASLAIARGRFAHQWAAADRKLKAGRALDALIATWMNSPTPTVPINRQGALPDARGFTWRTRIGRDSAAAKFGAMIVRVEVFDRGNEEKASASPTVAVDLLVRLPPKRAATRPSASAEDP